MLIAYTATPSGLVRHEGGTIPDGAVWVDLVNPAAGEDAAVERATGIAVPTREEMSEIEVSSRLYVENGARYMTATLLCHADSEHPVATNVTFILAGKCLVTVRYDEPKPFELYASRACKSAPAPASGEAVLIGLLEAVIDRAADVLERVGADIDEIAKTIFHRTPANIARKASYQITLARLGRKGDLLSKGRESLATIARVLLFLAAEVEGQKVPKEMKAQLRTMQRDVESINYHADFQINRVTFLLDALVGLVSIQQNDIIKLFSVVAVVLLPPTTVASIYGMNFQHMPELEWTFGYPMALVLMVISAIVPYLFFRWKKWL